MASRFTSDQPSLDDKLSRWLKPSYDQLGKIRRPHQMLNESPSISEKTRQNIRAIHEFQRIHGSMLGMAIGDALGAPVEFRPHDFLRDNPVSNFQSGGTWGLAKGQFTDDTTMALCLAASLIVRRDLDLYDQLVRYKWWFRSGYMSSTGECFDIGAATKEALQEFETRQTHFMAKHRMAAGSIDDYSGFQLPEKFNTHCGKHDAAGNGALMRLAPVPLFFYRDPIKAVDYCGQSSLTTHGDMKSRDACRYYGALIVAALQGEKKNDLLDEKFYEKHRDWFGDIRLHQDIMDIAKGSYKRKDGYDGGIRGGGYVVAALEAALWAFYQDDNSFRKGVLAAVNLGDDTDTTAAIYGQLAGAYYGVRQLADVWKEAVYAKDFVEAISIWIFERGKDLHTNQGEVRASKKRTQSMPDPSLIRERESTKPESVKGIGNELGVIVEGRSKSAAPHRAGEKEFPILRRKKRRGENDVPPDFKSYVHVGKWIESLGVPLSNYKEDFRKHEVTGKMILYQIDRVYLETVLLISNKKHRTMLMGAIMKKRQDILNKEYEEF